MILLQCSLEIYHLTVNTIRSLHILSLQKCSFLTDMKHVHKHTQFELKTKIMMLRILDWPVLKAYKNLKTSE